MRIVVLDGRTTNPGDISWEPLAALGELTVYDTTPPELAIARAREADAVIHCRMNITAELIDALPRLRYLGTLSTGYNTTDLQAAARRGIPVCNVPQYCAGTVAQFTFSLLLALCNRVESHSARVKAGRWEESVDTGTLREPFVELQGKTLGLFGYGSIARRVGAIARAMGMQVLAFRRHPQPEEGVAFVSREELLRRSDVISIHCPLTPQTRHTFNAETLAAMKPGALLINTARGAVVEEAAVAAALHSGALGGYGADVFETEPDLSRSPLCTAPNTVLTPHIAWASREARQRLVNEVAENLRVWMNGGERNRVK